MYGGCSGDVRGLFKNSNSINHTEESITSQNPFPIHWKCMGGMLTLSFSFPLGRRKGRGVMSGPPGIHELNFSRKSEGIEPVLLLNGIFVFYPPGIHDPLHRHTSVRWPYKIDESFMVLDRREKICWMTLNQHWMTDRSLCWLRWEHYQVMQQSRFLPRQMTVLPFGKIFPNGQTLRKFLREVGTDSRFLPRVWKIFHTLPPTLSVQIWTNCFGMWKYFHMPIRGWTKSAISPVLPV